MEEVFFFSSVFLSCLQLETQLTQFLEMGCPQSFFSRLIDGVLSQEGTDGGGEQCLARWFGPVVSNLCDHLNLHSVRHPYGSLDSYSSSPPQPFPRLLFVRCLSPALILSSPFFPLASVLWNARFLTLAPASFTTQADLSKAISIIIPAVTRRPRRGGSNSHGAAS